MGTRGARGCAVVSGICRWWEMRLEHPHEDPTRLANKLGLVPENQEGGRIGFQVSGAHSGFVRKRMEEGTARGLQIPVFPSIRNTQTVLSS